MLGPFLRLLRQGTSPEEIALTVALGVVLGIIPVLGSTMLLCTLAAVSLRLNLGVIQLVNGVVYPLQLLLLIPFYKSGAWLFGADASVISLNGVLSLIEASVANAVSTLWVVTMHALAAWLVIGAVTAGVVYVVLTLLLRRAHSRLLT